MQISAKQKRLKQRKSNRGLFLCLPSNLGGDVWMCCMWCLNALRCACFQVWIFFLCSAFCCCTNWLIAHSLETVLVYKKTLFFLILFLFHLTSERYERYKLKREIMNSTINKCVLPQVPSMSLLNCLYCSAMMSPFGKSWTAITELVSSHIDYW